LKDPLQVEECEVEIIENDVLIQMIKRMGELEKRVHALEQVVQVGFVEPALKFTESMDK